MIFEYNKMISTESFSLVLYSLNTSEYQSFLSKINLTKYFGSFPTLHNQLGNGAAYTIGLLIKNHFFAVYTIFGHVIDSSEPL